MTNRRIPPKYLANLSKLDAALQKQEIIQSRKAYKQGKLKMRTVKKSHKHKPSKHVAKAKRVYGVDVVTPRTLSKPTGCSVSSLEKIVRKGRGAYFSSGSRPNTTPSSWAFARLASAVTGGRSSCVDIHELREGCDASSQALAAAEKACAPRRGVRRKAVKSMKKWVRGREIKAGGTKDVGLRRRVNRIIIMLSS